MAKLRGWRKKDRERFTDDALVAVRYGTGNREVFDYHERICDRIDAAGRNETRVSLFQLAREIHDDSADPAGHDEWLKTRTAVIEQMRDLDRIRFEGDVLLHRTLVISLPPKTYQKWHGQGSHFEQQEREPSGKFGPKKPAHTDDHRDGDETVPSPSDDRSDDGPMTAPIPSAYETRPDQTEDQTEGAAAAAPRAHVREAAAAVDAGSHPESGILPSVTDPDAKANDERVRCQRLLGSSSMAVQEIADHHAAKFPGASPARVVREVWQPLASLKRRLPDVFDAALSKALRRSSPAWSGQLVVQIADELAVENDAARGALPAGETDEFDELVQPYTVEAS